MDSRETPNTEAEKYDADMKTLAKIIIACYLREHGLDEEMQLHLFGD